VYAAIISLLSPEDYVGVNYHEVSCALLRGVDPVYLFRCLYYNQFNSYTSFCDKIISGTSRMVGVAFDLCQTKFVHNFVCFVDEEYIEENRFFESLDTAILYNMPILFLCNNPQKIAIDKEISKNYISSTNLHDICEKTSAALTFIKYNSRPFLLEYETPDICPLSIVETQLINKKDLEIIHWNHIKSDIQAGLLHALEMVEYESSSLNC
jgi:hypothetical protein